MRRRRLAASIAAVFAVVASAVVVPAVVHADGPTTFTNSAAISIPATGSANQIGIADPYPSAITVTGMAGAVTAVQVIFHGVSHTTLNDVDAMLVAPTGANLVVLSDIGDPTTTLSFANNATLTFSDSAAGVVPTGNVPTGTYRPTNNGAGDLFSAPAPAPSAQTTLAGAFTGINPNGTWQLFVNDDQTGDVGSMSGGWSVVITTETAAVATTTTVATSGTPSATGSPVTFTASVTAGGSPVTAGTVTFAIDGAPSPPVPVNGSGTATFTTSSLAEGTRAITATYSGAAGFLTSNGSVSQRVDNATIVTDDTYCNPGALTLPPIGQSSPYPSNITVTGLTSNITKVTATLNGVSHTVPVDLDIMLSGPVPTTNVMLMSDVGGTTPVSGATITFDDDAAGPVPTPLTAGTFRPTDDDADAADAAFPAPAPVVSSATALSTFDGASGNGTWSLWVVDDATGDTGSISGGWCLTFTTAEPAVTTTTLTSSSNPSTQGGSVTFTATVTSGGAPVTSGSISIDTGMGMVTLPVGASGSVTHSTNLLTVGSHVVTATYLGTTDYATSTGTLTQVVNAPLVADAGGPYTVAEGASLSLDGSGSTAGATYAWDLDGDGDFTDATGLNPTLTWADLEALGIDDGPSTHTVTLRVTRGADMLTGTADLDVTNTAPDTVVSGALTATAGVPFTIKVGADDPSSADMAALFDYTVDWGDGSPVLRVSGPADPPVTHTYAAPGTYSASLTSTDKDGGTGPALVITVVAAAAPSPSPSPSPTPTPIPRRVLPPTGVDATAGILAAGMLLLVGAMTLAVGRTRRPSRQRR